MQNMRYVKYICSDSECKAEDTDKLFPHESPAPALNCWKCGAGFKPRMELGAMLMQHVGMFPQLEEEHAAKKGRRAVA